MVAHGILTQICGAGVHQTESLRVRGKKGLGRTGAEGNLGRGADHLTDGLFVVGKLGSKVRPVEKCALVGDLHLWRKTVLKGCVFTVHLNIDALGIELCNCICAESFSVRLAVIVDNACALFRKGREVIVKLSALKAQDQS